MNTVSSQSENKSYAGRQAGRQAGKQDIRIKKKYLLIFF